MRKTNEFPLLDHLSLLCAIVHLFLSWLCSRITFGALKSTILASSMAESIFSRAIKIEMRGSDAQRALHALYSRWRHCRGHRAKPSFGSGNQLCQHCRPPCCRRFRSGLGVERFETTLALPTASDGPFSSTDGGAVHSGLLRFNCKRNSVVEVISYSPTSDKEKKRPTWVQSVRSV